MIAVTVYQTFDKLKHDTKRDATKHLDKLYGDILLRVSRELVDKRYMEMSEYIDVHLETFVALKKIKDDMILHSEDEDEG